MCGIFAVSGEVDEGAGLVVMEGLKKLEYRGYDSWGIAIRRPSRIHTQKNIGKISEVEAEFHPSGEAIGHSRWATHGGVTPENAHPHTYEGVTLVHNGIFENYKSEKDRLSTGGNEFASETDTEVIAHLIAEKIEAGLEPVESVRQVSQSITGRFSLLVMIQGMKGIIAARRGSPLILGRDKHTTYIASDIPAFLEHTQVVNYLDDDEMAFIRDENVEFMDILSGDRIEKRNIEVSWKEEVAEKGEYDHFMIKEIFDQKSSLKSAINHTESEILDFLGHLKSGNGVYLVACGTAHKASLAAEYYFSEIAGRKVNVVAASEMSAFMRFVNEKTILFAVSQSGETADILEVLEQGKKKNATVISITNVESSSIAHLSDCHLPLRAGKEKAVASTKATTSQMALLLLLAYADAGRLNDGQKVLQNLAANINELLNPRYESYIQQVSQKLDTAQNIFIIGRNSLFPMALESAIKILEVSYVHAQGFAAGEMKHGPIALIEDGTPCIVLGDDSETISNTMELKSRGAHIIGIAPANAEVFDDWIRIPEADSAQSIAAIVPVQILAYYLATQRNLDPDMPRNLAKSVTVK